ncbi:MAG: glycosyltransferase family 4 protein, partial [Clostridium neonatale]
MKEKIAFVVQRYGLEVNGGAELYCRQVAEKLSKYYEVDILTTCALDYMTWKNYYIEGKEVINNVNVIRFKVDKERNVNKFNKLSEKILINPSQNTYEENIEWIEEQGPVCNDLINYLKENNKEYKSILFMTYLYWTTFWGLEVCPEKSILIPTAHDEPPIYLNIFKEKFNSPKFIAYNTYDEMEFVNKLFNNKFVNSDIFGVGVDLPENIKEVNIREKYNFSGEYILYVGRIDESKGCGELFEYYLRYIKETRRDIKLVLIGKAVMDIPKHKNIIPIGFVSDEDKFNAIKQSKLVVISSKYESLSMILLESLKLNKPVVVNGNCSVLKTHCIKSNAGLYYQNYNEFKEILKFMFDNKKEYELIGNNGSKYVDNNYDWNIIVKKMIKCIK